MMLRIPFAMDVEYRGMKPGGEFIRRDTGEKVEFGPSIRFEVDEANGDVSLFPVSAGQLDKLTPPFDVGTLAKGQKVRLEGTAVIQDRGSDRDSFVQITAASLLDGAKLRAAS